MIIKRIYTALHMFAGVPEDVAHATAFFASKAVRVQLLVLWWQIFLSVGLIHCLIALIPSQQASMVTGQTMHVSGGLVLP